MGYAPHVPVLDDTQTATNAREEKKEKFYNLK
nr:MAG TPA: hypothetical protein [Caudoviricetes sp.]